MAKEKFLVEMELEFVRIKKIRAFFVKFQIVLHGKKHEKDSAAEKQIFYNANVQIFLYLHFVWLHFL